VSTTPAHLPGRRWRLSIATAMSVLAAAVSLVVAPAPAHAQPLLPPGNFDCSTPNIPWQRFFGDIYHAVIYNLVSATPRFDVADARVVENGLSAPVSATFTSQQSRTFTLSVSVGSTVKVGEIVTATVGVTVTQSRTTTIGISVTTTVPALSRVLGEYGLSAYDVVYDLQHLWRDKRHCAAENPVRGTGYVPTVVEGWRFRQV
jgi:hypothetical protein